MQSQEITELCDFQDVDMFQDLDMFLSTSTKRCAAFTLQAYIKVGKT